MPQRGENGRNGFMKGAITGVCVAGAFAVGVGLGPLDPPAGPVTETGPDLGQILDAVNGLSGAGGSCASQQATPGEMRTAMIDISGIGSSDIIEFEVGARTSVVDDGMGGTFAQPPEAKTVTVTRLSDNNSPLIFDRLVSGTVIQSVEIAMNNTTGNMEGVEEFTMDNVFVTGLCNVMVNTCDGMRYAEKITFEVSTLEYRNGPIFTGWDFSNNSPTR